MDSKKFKEVFKVLSEIDDSSLEGIEFELRANGRSVDPNNVKTQISDNDTEKFENGCVCMVIFIIAIWFALVLALT